MFKTNRKTKIYLLNIIVAVASSLFIPDAKYNLFLDYSLYLSVAFFAANTLSKIPVKLNENNITSGTNTGGAN